VDDLLRRVGSLESKVASIQADLNTMRELPFRHAALKADAAVVNSEVATLRKRISDLECSVMGRVSTVECTLSTRCYAAERHLSMRVNFLWVVGTVVTFTGVAYAVAKSGLL
jgi:hypothetical protein